MSQNKFTTNNNPTLVAVSNVDNEAPVYLWADPNTHALLVSASVSLSGTSDVNVKQIGGVATSVGSGVYDTGTQRTAIAVPTTVIHGQATTTGSAVQFGSNTLTVGVIVQAISTNVANVYIGIVGVTSATGFELQPGQATSVATDNTSDLYVIGTNGDKVCFIGS